MTPTVAICIPVYYSGPEVPRVLDELIQSINKQTYENIVVLASVQPSKDIDGNKRVMSVLSHCTKEARAIGSSGTSPATNTNVAIDMGVNAGHRYIKIMNQDDLLDSETAIADMVQALESSDAEWLVSACRHTDSEGVKRERLHIPHWPGEKNMVEAVNRIGCPSVVMFDASLGARFDPDPHINYAMDCEFYIQLHRLAGPPVIYSQPDVVVRMWPEQLTNQMNVPREIELGKAYMRKKYNYA